MTGFRIVFWTLASMILLAGLSVLGFRVAMQVAPEYRDRVALDIGNALQADVSLQRLALGWEGWGPAIELRNLRLQPRAAQDAGDPLTVGSVRVGLDVWALLRGELQPRRLALSQSTLPLVHGPQGWRLRGWPAAAATGAGRPGWQQILEPFDRLRLADISVQAQWADGAQGSGLWVIRQAQLRRSGEQRSIEVSARSDADARVDVELDLQGWQPQRISGTVQDLSLEVWRSVLPTEVLLPAVQIHSLRGQAERVAAPGTVPEWHFQVTLAAAVRTPAAADASSGPRAPESTVQVSAPLQGAVSSRGLQLQSAALRVVDEAQDWPVQSVFVDYQPHTPGRLRLQAQWLDLGGLWPHLQPYLPAAAPEWIRGQLTDLTLSWERATVWPAAVGRFSGLGFALRDPQASVQGLDGEFSSDGPRGRVVIHAEQVDVDWQALFADATRFDALSGTVDWARTTQGLQWELPDLAYSVSGVDGVGRVAQQADGSWHADARFLAPDLQSVRTRMPVFWHPNLRNWLNAAIRAGELREGHLQLEGRREEALRSQIDLDLANVDFLFAEGWDPLQVERGQLRIHDQDLSVHIPQARLRDVELRELRADLQLVPDALLAIRAGVEGDSGQILRILGESPIGPQLRATRRSIALRGPVTAALDLEIDLHGQNRTRWAADAQLQGVDLRLTDWPSPLRDLQGPLRLSAAGLSSDGLRGRMNGWPLQLDASRRGGRTTVRATARPDLSRLPASWPLPSWLTPRLGGRPEILVEAAFGGADSSEIVVRSDLIGGSVTLPPPLATPEEQARRLWLRVRPEERTLELSLGQMLGLHATNLGAAEPRLALRLGSDTASPAPVPGLWVDGSLEAADVEAWLALLRDITAPADAGPEQNRLAFGGINLRIGQLAWGEQRWANTDLQVLRSADSWLANLRGETLNGQLLLNQRADAGLAIAGQFDRLDWTYVPRVPDAAAPLPAWSPPASLPALDVRVARFRLNSEDLGTLTLAVSPTPDGYVLDTLRIGDSTAPVAGGGTGLTLSGRVRPSASHLPAGELSFAVDTAGSAAWLRALRYADWLQASALRASGEIRWQEPADLAALRVSGDVHLRLESGRLLSVNPGAGRFLGLLSVTALPRRFLLDFSDMTDAGLGFDLLEGHYALSNGVARTDSLKISGPSVRIEAEGAVDLVRREQDQVVTIMPGISHGFTAAATVLGGPAMGLFLLFAQELLDKPLDQVGQISYRLTGPLDNPLVEARP